MRIKTLVLGAVAIGGVTTAVVALGLTLGMRPTERARGGDVVRVARRDIGRVVKATGVIKPMIGAEVRVGSRVSGVVKRLFVRIGDRVEKGQLLAELDDRELVARRDQADASLAVSLATFNYAKADLERKRALSASRLIAPSDLDLAQQAASVAEQQSKAARASLEDAATQLGYARIVAPIGGVVASVSTQEGETVAASFATPTFVTLLDLARLEVWAYVDETDIGRIQRGLSARFTVDTYGDHEFEGHVTAIYPQAEIRDNVVNYITVVRFDPPRDRLLRPEMTTTVRVALERHAHVLALPLRAVRRESGRPFVWCRRGDGIERRWITTGSQDESYWEIVDGVRKGDEVLVGDVSEATQVQQSQPSNVQPSQVQPAQAQPNQVQPGHEAMKP
jgi:RND family efflux transporter MFP subunit